MRLLADWLESNSKESRSRIILAPDVVGPYASRVGKAAGLVSSMRGRIVGVKVNWHLLLPYGVFGLGPLVDACKSAGLPLIADVKLNDVGSTNLEVADILFSNGFDALIANPFAGYKEGIEEVIEKGREMHKAVVLLVYMSHRGAREGYGLSVGGAPLYRRFARKTRQWGADGAVVSSKSPWIIREVRSILRRDQLIFSPGVGFQGGDGRKALAAGSDYLIVGRSIIDAKDPVGEVGALNKEFESRDG